MNIRIVLLIVITMSLINGIFTHNGVTVLFIVNDNRFTAEAFLYGGCMALMLGAVLVWFGCFQVLMSSDKFIFLFGRLAPVLGLTLSMIFRFVPLLQQRFREIHNGQKCMGRNHGSWFQKIRQFFKEISILISWSLEASIESADSMEARGYGLRGRSSFHLYRFTKRDGIMTGILCFFGILSVIGVILGKASIYYYPHVAIAKPDAWFCVTVLSYVGLMITPMVIDIQGEYKWNLEM